MPAQLPPYGTTITPGVEVYALAVAITGWRAGASLKTNIVRCLEIQRRATPAIPSPRPCGATVGSRCCGKLGLRTCTSLPENLVTYRGCAEARLLVVLSIKLSRKKNFLED
jgi:hypothetical protein